MMHVARMALLMGRQETGLALHRDILVPVRFRERSETAFNAATIHGAKAVGRGNTIGSTQEEKLADFIVFDTSNPNIACAAENDPLTATVRLSEVGDIEMGIIDGIIQKKRRYVPLNPNNRKVLVKPISSLSIRKSTSRD
jgi:cytosine/adenosine deaminase-related metal-dependent hydrolase